MSDTVNLARAFKLPVEDVAHEFGQQLPARMAKFENWLRTRNIPFASGLLETAKSTLAGLPWRDIIKYAAGVFEIPRAAVPISGPMGDALHEYAEEALTEVARGLSAAKQGGQGKTGDAKGPATAANDPDGMGFITQVVRKGINVTVWNSSQCAHPDIRPPRVGKDASRSVISMRRAVALGFQVSDCGCVGTPDEVAALVKRIQGDAPVKSADGAGSAQNQATPQQHVEARPTEHTLFGHWRQLQTSRPELYTLFFGNFCETMRRDAQFHDRCLEAFGRPDAREDFVFFLEKIKSWDWQTALDMLVGPHKESVGEREGRQWAEVFQVLAGLADESKPARDAWRASRKARHAELQARKMARRPKMDDAAVRRNRRHRTVWALAAFFLSLAAFSTYIYLGQ